MALLALGVTACGQAAPTAPPDRDAEADEGDGPLSPPPDPLHDTIYSSWHPSPLGGT